MKSYPILFSGAMVRAILNGSKTQTRRVVNPQPWLENGFIYWTGNTFTYDITKGEHCPYGRPGDRLWVKETWGVHKIYDSLSPRLVYSAMGADMAFFVEYEATPRNEEWKGKWRPSIHMPRSASRINLEVVAVRVERIQEITGSDAFAEGVENGYANPSMGNRWEAAQRMAFERLWDYINSDRAPWLSNPWVWVVEFKRI